MGWKNWPSWLKGGIIIGIIGFVITLFFGASVIPSILIPDFSNGVPAFSMYYLWIISFLFYFIIGAIIGWLIEKFKK